MAAHEHQRGTSGPSVGSAVILVEKAALLAGEVLHRALLGRSRCAALAGPLVAASCVLPVDLRRTPAEGGDEQPPIATNADIRLLDTDPLHDGTAEAALVLHHGSVWAGPSSDGRRLAQYSLDGSSLGARTFSIAADQGGAHTNSNSTPPPYQTFGAPNCIINTAACGPDNEGSAVFLAGVNWPPGPRAENFAGADWLVAGASRADGGVRYLYMGQDGGDDVIAFAPVELSAVLDDVDGASNALGLATVAVVGERLYLGLPATGAKRPRLLALLHPPPDPEQVFEARATGTCDPAIDDVCDLQLDQVPLLAETSSVAGIDAVVRYEGRTYLADAAVVLQADSTTPTAGELWTDATSNDARLSESQLVSATGPSVQTRDKGTPGLINVGTGLVMLKNTQDGARVFVCQRDDSAPTFQCGAWHEATLPSEFVASVDPLDPNNGGRISALALVRGVLLLALDNSTGALFAACPLIAGVINDTPQLVTFDLLGDPGLGNPSLTRVIGAVDVGDAAFVLLGDGTTPGELFRIAIGGP